MPTCLLITGIFSSYIVMAYGKDMPSLSDQWGSLWDPHEPENEGATDLLFTVIVPT